MTAGIGLALMGLMMVGMMLGGHRMGRKGHKHAEPETAVCPVSGNSLSISSATTRATVGGKIYYFDDEEHQRRFVLEPDKFLKGR